MTGIASRQVSATPLETTAMDMGMGKGIEGRPRKARKGTSTHTNQSRD